MALTWRRWSQPGCRRDAEFVADYVSLVNKAGGVVALVAHLPKSAGGRGLPANGKFSFSGRDDPLWKELRGLFCAGAAFAAQTPEPDEAGFVPRSRGRLEYETLLKTNAVRTSH